MWHQIFNMHMGGVTIRMGMLPKLSWACFLQVGKAFGHLLQPKRAALPCYASELPFLVQLASSSLPILTNGDNIKVWENLQNYIFLVFSSGLFSSEYVWTFKFCEVQKPVDVGCCYAKYNLYINFDII
jgi:hypothetical protein